MAFSPSRLSGLQRRFLDVFASHTDAFFLTGGAVLAGWVLGHRRTDDLDLFTLDDVAMASGDSVVRRTAAEIGATVESLRVEPDFRRYLVRTAHDSVIIDLVRERVPQLHEKVRRDGIRVDAIEEIVANKICALLGRWEVRDLVDLLALERAGYRVEDHLEDAARKDGGVSAATLAWVLSSVRIPDRLPEGFDAPSLEAFRADLEQRLRAVAAAQASRG